ncbi:MAG: hypothetical protein BMS9Abin05_2190 [Rhodothermia bacterium]|nr:MAG: hypothetical protein BMS9Abin05_2190 [Rhodothermia bacterium]
MSNIGIRLCLNRNTAMNVLKRTPLLLVSFVFFALYGPALTAEAGELAIDEFKLQVRSVVDGLSSTEFWLPGSTLRVKVDNTNPLAFGMPENVLATFLGENDAYQIVPSAYNDRVERIVTFIDRDILQSGWLIGEDVISKKAAMVSVDRGEGKIILIGFRAQHRMQTHGTFKLVFNALVSGPED